MNEALADPSVGFAIELATDILLKATVVLGIAGLASWWLRGASAALRNAVWSLALGSLLLLPLLSATLPGWKLDPLYVAVEPVVTASHPGGTLEGGALDSRAVPDAAESDALRGRGGQDGTSSLLAGGVGAPPEEPEAAGFSMIEIALLIWSCGVVFLLGRIGLDLLRIFRLTHGATEAPVELTERTRRLAVEAGVQRPVRVLLSDAVTVPLTWGAWAPVVILPRAAATWPAERTRVVLLHELAHIERWDYPALLMTEIVCAVYWLNPLVWIAAKQGAMERERACDDRALYSGIASDVYAGHLLEIARAQVEAEAPRAAFALTRPWSLSTRVRMIFARGLDRAPLTRGRMLSAGLAALLLALPLASVELWGTAQADPVGARVRELRDDDPRTRRYAAWALGEIEDRRAVRPLVERLGDGDADVRLVAAWALGEVKDRAAVQPLVRLLDDDDPLVREMAVLSLGEIEHPSAIEPLTAALRRHPELREPVIWALGEIRVREAERQRDVVFAEWGRRPRDNHEVWSGHLRRDAARPPARDSAALIRALDDVAPEVRRSAARRLGLRGEEVGVEPLLETLRDPDAGVRAMAVWALDEINPSRPRSSD